MNNVTTIFLDLTQKLDKESQLRDEIKKVTKEIEGNTRQIISILQQVHSNLDKVQDICTSVRNLFNPIKEEILKLQEIIKNEPVFKYHDLWKLSISQLVFSGSFIFWLEERKLITITEVDSLIGVSKNGSLSIEIEDYLFGLCSLPNELSRLAVNSVISGDFSLPFQISSFVSDLYSGFRLLNLKNDNLRKRYDSIKYDMKKIEEVVYDIKIRGLQKNV